MEIECPHCWERQNITTEHEGCDEYEAFEVVCKHCDTKYLACYDFSHNFTAYHTN